VAKYRVMRLPALTAVVQQAAAYLIMLASPSGAAAATLSWTPTDAWRLERRGTATLEPAGAVLLGKMALWKAQEFGDFDLRCHARISEGVKDGAIWLRFRYRSENEHYALALRGWPAEDLYLYRFGPNGMDRLVALEPLRFSPAPGKWYDLRVSCAGPKIDVYVNGESRPRISVTDDRPLAAGLVGVGGGYREAEYAELQVETTLPVSRARTDQARAAQQAAAARRRQRGALRARCRPVQLPRAEAGRQVVPLDGPWLFLPDQERDPRKDPRDPRADDRGWHAMEVPAFWTPVSWWNYGPGEGTSELWVQRERARMAALSFDPERTHAAWYREWIDVPRTYQGKRLALQFDAVAMACAVWLNGRSIGSHVGMFAPFELELPPEAVRPGSLNLVTVLVTDGPYQTTGNPADLLGAEVAGQLTPEWLSGLPRGMYGRSAGIWQPVRLVATSPLHIAEVYVRPALDGFDAEVTVAGAPVEGALLRATVTDAKTTQQLVQTQTSPGTTGPPVTLSAHGLAVNHWMPDAPYLYSLATELLAPDGKTLDTDDRAIGFRTFAVNGNHFLLNGRPYWLRGAGYPPSALAPNSAELANVFLGRMHDGNEVMARAQGSSFTEPWLKAADEKGVGVSLEGVWPWVMINDTPPPAPELVGVWQAEWLGVMRKVRNHPSVLMWTLNNESLWYRAQMEDVRKRKWEIATRIIQAMRQLDPTRPVVCDSCYIRDLQVFEAEVKPNGFDDGDVDDGHFYYGWYTDSPWRLYPEDVAGLAPAPLERPFSGIRPAISQEFSAGYPNSDTGHPARKYVDQHHVAQAWVGDYAHEDRDPSVFLNRHAWLTKESIEVARRHRSKLCGLLSFCNSTWFRLPFDPSALEPYPVYEAARTALAPVLISADVPRRHFYAGDPISLRACIVNDSPDGADLPTATIQAQLVALDGTALAVVGVQVPPVPYYETRFAPLTLQTPAELPRKERAEYAVVLGMKAGERHLAENRFPLLGASKAWADADVAAAAAREGLTAGEGGTLVATGAAGVAALRARPELQQFVMGGGRILVMNAGEAAEGLLPDVIEGVVDWRPEIVSFADEASPVLDGLEPWDVCWLNTEGGPPVAATGGYRLRPVKGVKVIATGTRPHGYLKDPAEVQAYTAVVVLEASVGKGKVIVSEIPGAAAQTDPIAAKVISNLLKYLAGVA